MNTEDQIKKLQEEVVRLERLSSIGQITAGILHEIKNPLNFINNFAKLSVELVDEFKEILEDEGAGINNETLEEFNELLEMLYSNVNKIHEHGARADRIVKGMLAQTRGASHELEMTEINPIIADFAKLAYHGVRGENSDFNLEFIFNLDESLKKVNISPFDFSRVILNIVNNACFAVNQKILKYDYTYKPQITISSSVVNEMVVVKIKDNGIGMSKKIREKIFKAFFTTKSAKHGTGLGLSMSYDIITNMHKGSIDVNSIENEYTEFVLTIPL